MKNQIAQAKELLRRSLFVNNSNKEGQLIYDFNRFNAKLRDEVENNEDLKALYEMTSLIEERIRRFGC